MKNGKPSAYLTITLHAHLPYVVHHGTWPHGLEWLLEAAAETYLPLLRVLGNLERDGMALKANINLSPVLLEQLAHPTFKAEFPEYLKRKILAAREDENYFRQAGESTSPRPLHMAHFFRQAHCRTSRRWIGDIIVGFRHFNDAGADRDRHLRRHPWLPAAAGHRRERRRRRWQTGVATHQRHLGKRPRGIWVAGVRLSPRRHVAAAGRRPRRASNPGRPAERIGVEEVSCRGRDSSYFFVDTHLIEDSVLFTPYQLRAGRPRSPRTPCTSPLGDMSALYRPYWSRGRCRTRILCRSFRVTRRPACRCGAAIPAIPADANYLDFHKKRWPGGHRYWQVTDPRADMAAKTPYCGAR